MIDNTWPDLSGWHLPRLDPGDAALISTGRQDLGDLALSLTDAADTLTQIYADALAAALAARQAAS